MSNLSGSATWSTKDELEFITELGHHEQPGLHQKRQRLTRLELVKRYIQTIQRRKRWGMINKTQVIIHASAVLSTLSVN